MMPFAAANSFPTCPDITNLLGNSGYTRRGCNFASSVCTLVQVGLGTLAPQFPESLHVPLLRCPGPRGVLICQDVCHSAVCSELLRLWLRILEVQLDLLHAHNSCYHLFILCKLEHGSNREMRGYASGAYQTDIKERVFADTIRECHIDSAPRSCMHVARRSECCGWAVSCKPQT